MRPVFSQYLYQILEGFAYYAETGEQVNGYNGGVDCFHALLKEGIPGHTRWGV